MKKLLAFGLIALLISPLFAADRKVTDYSMHGKTDVDMFRGVLTDSSAVAGPLIRASIDTNSQYQFRPIIASLQPPILTATGDDSIKYACFTVPAGMTAKIRAVTLSAAVEYDVANPATVELMIINITDTDTIVDEFSIDEDSCIYNNVALALTINDTTTLDAGDVVHAYVMGDSTLDVVCEGCALMFDIDWDE